jgi:hypothetical protein
MEIFHLETEQAVQHVKLIMAHIRRDDEVGKMLHTSIDYTCNYQQAHLGWSYANTESK